MKLLNLIEAYDENKNLYVYMNGTLVATYDGRDSIPNELNDYEVIDTTNGTDGLIVEIGTENDIVNKVHKVITDDTTTTFIIKTLGDTDFWWWQVDNEDISKFFVKHCIDGTLTTDKAEFFANHIDNSDLGTSCASFETIEDALKDLR